MARARSPLPAAENVDLAVTNRAYACHEWVSPRHPSVVSGVDLARLHVMRTTIAALFHPPLRHVVSGIEVGQDDGRAVSKLLASHGLLTGDPVYVVLPRYLTVVHADLVRAYFRGLTRVLDKRHVGIDADRGLEALARSEDWCAWH